MKRRITTEINCESAIGQHLLTNPECAKTYTDDNFRIIGQGRSSFHLSVLERKGSPNPGGSNQMTGFKPEILGPHLFSM